MYSQAGTEPIEVTPAIDHKIRLEIAKDIDKLKTQLLSNKESDILVQFTVDTFRIERYQSKYVDYDWSTSGMNKAGYDAAKSYDSLLNRYYKKLMAVLKPVDKTVLVNAQKSWMAFRDNEIKLIGCVGKEEYSGGGTMQSLIDSSEYLEIIKQRTISIFGHYLRATQSF